MHLALKYQKFIQKRLILHYGIFSEGMHVPTLSLYVHH